MRHATSFALHSKVVWKWWATAAAIADYGAGEGIRTLDVNLGKVALYH
jgi:hypothetical protein